MAPKVAGQQVRILADHLPRVQLPHRVEGVLDLAEDLDQLAELSPDELGAPQAARLGTGDRAARLQDDVVDAGGQRLQPLAIVLAPQVQEGPEPQSPLAGAGVHGPRDVARLKEPLEAPAPRPAGPAARRRRRRR